MVVDDGMVRDLLSQLFVGKGGRITVASSGAEGIKLFKRHIFDLVIVDMHASNVKSSGIVPRVKEMKPELPVALINYEEEGKAKALLKKLGADLLLGTPLDMDRVLILISRLLSEKEA